ncbi:MAG TPA: hypothetical protein VG387_04005 [Rhizomicrobium sp.]|jgi:hypothetical protein|nr:hypothetical protein [Rhizomicrobium sp.]
MAGSFGAIALLTILLASAARSETLDDLPVPLRRDVTCMADLLRKIPGVDHVVAGVERGRNLWTMSDEMENPPVWFRPFVEYSVTDSFGKRATLRFAADRMHHDEGDTYSFWTLLPGAAAEGGAPRDWGARQLIDSWKSACGVRAGIMRG